MEPWFFVSSELLQHDIVILSQELIRHLRVLRMQPGDLMVLADGKGNAFRARLESLTNSGGEALLLGEAPSSNEPLFQVTFFAGVTKGEKMDLAVRQSVELGIIRIVPVLSERSVPRLTAAKKEEKRIRWQKIAAAAAEQCRRSRIPEVTLPLDFDEMIVSWSEEKFETIIVPWEEEKTTSLRQTLENLPAPKKIAFFTGPEGGISPQEIEQIKKIPGVYPVTLGPRILRAETAPATLLSILMYNYEWKP